MVKSIFTRFLILAIEGLNNLISYVQHDIRHGSARKTVAISIILLFVVGLGLVGSGVTGQIILARESATELSNKLGAIEAEFQKLSVTYGLLEDESKLCADARDRYLNDLDGCKTNLNQRTTDYNTAKSNYDKCSNDLSTKTNEYNTCSSSLSAKANDYNNLQNNHTNLTTSYNNLVSQKNSIVVNAVVKFCCPLTTNPTIDYQLDSNNKIFCGTEGTSFPAPKTGTVTC